MNNKNNRSYPPEDDSELTISDEEDFTYEEYEHIRQTASEMPGRKVQTQQSTAPNRTAKILMPPPTTQFNQERRLHTAPHPRFKHNPAGQQQMPKHRQQMPQPPLRPTNPDYRYTAAHQPRTHPQRPRTANNERYFATTAPMHSQDYEQKYIQHVSEKFCKQNFIPQQQQKQHVVIPSNPNNMHSRLTSTRPAQPVPYPNPQQRVPPQAKNYQATSSSMPPADQLNIPKYEESRTSAAAKTIAAAMPQSTWTELSTHQDKPDDEFEMPPMSKSTIPASASGTTVEACGDGSQVQQESHSVPGSDIIEQALGLEKSKKEIVNQIDSVIKQMMTSKESVSKQSICRTVDAVSVSTSTDEDINRATTKSMKMKCIRKLEDELSRLKILEEFAGST